MSNEYCVDGRDDDNVIVMFLNNCRLLKISWHSTKASDNDTHICESVMTREK